MKQGNPTIGGEAVIVNTISAAVADPARRQALSASLTALVEKNALGYPTFSTITSYAAGETVFYDRRLYTFKTDHAAGAWNADEMKESDVRILISSEVKAALEAGDITPALADNLANWDERVDLAIEDTFTDRVRTAAGDQSINSAAGAQLVAITPLTDFSATALVTTGFNLLRNATQVGTAWYFLVPQLQFGSYATAEKPNGVLFTDSQGGALTPTVRFKSIADGVPTSTSQGSACTYTDSHGLRFFTTPGPGYLIVSGINRETACAHIGWSRRYNEYVGVDNVNDAGSSVSLSAVIAAVHDFGQLLTAERNGDTVADGIEFDSTAAKWYRRVGRVQPAWVTTANESDGNNTTYTHTATIADMKAAGIAECGSLALEVNANTVSYTDQSQEATADYVKYELATVATGTVAMSNAVAIEDWGLELLTGATGEAEVTMQYAQGYPDAVANLVNGGYQRRTAELELQIAALKQVVEGIGSDAEGFVRVAGSSSPALSYAHYSYGEPGGFTRDSVFSLLYPCLVGTKLSGDDAQVGKILHVLQKFGATTDADGKAVWLDLSGTPHAIDGSEGDVMIVNIEEYYRIRGRYTIDGTEYDVYLAARSPFTWHGIVAEKVGKGGVSPDYTVSHKDSDNVTRMHSVYNPEWAGSYSAPAGVVGKYVYSEDADGNITEEYDADQTLLGGSGGLHSTNLALYDGEQQAMNMNPDTTKTVPYFNSTAASVEDWYGLMLSEGGTFDAHNATRMGSGFCSNDSATSAADWQESASAAKNGIRIYDKDGAAKMYSPSTNAEITIGLTGSSDKLFGTITNAYRNPFKVMEAHRAVSHAVRHGVGELQWFAFEGNMYKYRSVPGFAGPQQGEMTCVVWKMMSSKLGAGCFDPTDKETSIEGNRIDLLFSVALYHGITTQASPSWWISGLVFTEDDAQNYEAYMQRDQALLVKTPNGEIAKTGTFAFEDSYTHVGETITAGSGYRKNYDTRALMVPDTNANKTGAGLHTYVGAYNYFTGKAASEGKKLVRGFRRGYFVTSTALSPLFVNANGAPSNTGTSIAFGTCCRIVD